MNLQNLIDMQKELDNSIREKKGLQGTDLVANTYVALQVELAEFANEAKWFKHWSSNQEPRRYDEKIDLENNRFRSFDPLLEEYIDGLHFFLSIAIQRSWEKSLWVTEQAVDGEDFDGDLSGNYLEMIYFLNNSLICNFNKEQIEEAKESLGFPPDQYSFRVSWIFFLNIGMNGFGFTREQIEQAYIDKNKINHERQENGY